MNMNQELFEKVLEKMKPNKLKQIIRNCERNGFTEFRKGTGKRKEVFNSHWNKSFKVHIKYKVTISVEKLKQKLEEKKNE